MKKHWNRLISLTLALAMAVVCLAGCGGAASSEAAPSSSASGSAPAEPSGPVEQTLKLATVIEGAADKTGYPWHNPGGIALSATYRTLLLADANLTDVNPDLAESYEISDDGLVYTFVLKDGLKWSDGEDLTADLRCKRTKQGNEINYARTRLVCAARAAGVDVYDTPFTDVNDDEGIVRDAEYAKSLGFSGKSAIAPRHVRVINEVFSPSAKDIEYARLVFEAIRIGKEQGKGAVSLRGKMIDKPIVERARQTLEIAKQLGLDGGAE